MLCESATRRRTDPSFGGSGHPEVFETPGFRVALPPEADQPEAEAIASLPGMRLELFNGFRKHHTN